jgi:hypothetical protein
LKIFKSDGGFEEAQKTTYFRLTQYAVLNEPSWFLDFKSSETAMNDEDVNSNSEDIESFSAWLLRQLLVLLSRESIADFHPNMIELLQAFIGSVHEVSMETPCKVNLYKELRYIISTCNGTPGLLLCPLSH